MRAEKPLQKTKKNNKEAQPRFNRAEIICLYIFLVLCFTISAADITSRANHPPLEGHGILAMGGITGPILHLKNFASTMLCPGQWKKATAHSQSPKLFSLPSWPLFPPFFPFLCLVSPFSLPTTDCSAVPPSSHSQVVLGVAYHHCLPQGKFLLLGLKSKGGRN